MSENEELRPFSAINWKQNLFVIWLSQFLAMVGFGCCMPFIPLLLKENLHIDDENLRGVYVSIYYLAAMVSLCIATAVWGMLADRFGRKLMLLRASYYRVNCKQIDVSISTGKKVYAAMTCEVENLPRKLGLQNAKDQYLPQAVNAIAPFLGKELERISNEQVAVSEVNLTLANFQTKPEARYVSEQVNRVAEILSAMSGVLNFTNVRQDVNKATCTFRIVYLKEQFPQGIANVLNAKLSGK